MLADNINPYLVDGPDVVVTNRTMPICAVPRMRFGSKAADGGHLILDSEEREVLVRETHRRRIGFGASWAAGTSSMELALLPLATRASGHKLSELCRQSWSGFGGCGRLA